LPDHELTDVLTKLDKLTILEVSGVDSPANQLPGWMVTKAGGGGAVLPMIIARDIANGDIEAPAEEVQKAKHLLRDPRSGQFRRKRDGEHPDVIQDDSGPLPMRHSGAVLPQLRRST
jgi:hypothetical protein